jgi:hypothetical protein
MVDRNLRDSPRVRKTKVHCNPETPLLVPLLPAPERYAAANRAEVKLEGLATDKGLGLAADLDAFLLVVIRPEHTIAPARRAVAGRRAIRLPFKLPSNRTTEAGPVNRLGLAFSFYCHLGNGTSSNSTIHSGFRRLSISL